MNISTISPDVFSARNKVYEQINTNMSSLFNLLFKRQLEEKAAEKARQGLIQSQQLPETPEPAVPEIQKGYPALSALGLGKTEESTLPVAPTEEGGATTAAVPSPLGMLMKNKPTPMPMTTETPAEPGVMQKLPLLGGLFKKTPEVTPTTQVPTPEYIPPEREYNQQIAQNIPKGMPTEYYTKAALWRAQPTEQRMLGEALKQAIETGDYDEYARLKSQAQKPAMQLVPNAQGGLTAVNKNLYQSGQDVGVQRPVTYAQKNILLRADDPRNPNPGREGVYTVKVDPNRPEGGFASIVGEIRDPIEASKIRAESYMKSRMQVVYDAKNNYAPRLRNAEQINAEPDRWLPAVATQKILDKTALLADMFGTIDNIRNAVKKIPDFDQVTATQMSEMLRHTTDKEWFGANIQMAVGKTLTPDQADYLIALAQLRENSLAVRSILNAGPGSDQLRDAILATLPRAGTPNKMMAIKYIDAYEETLKRLGRGIPPLPLNPKWRIGEDPSLLLNQPAPGAPAVTAPGTPIAPGTPKLAF